MASCGGGDDERGDGTFTTTPVTSASAGDDGSGGGSGNGTGSADDDGGGSGSSGDDGSGGSFDDTSGQPPVEYPACQYACTTAADCTVGGDDFAFACIGGRCGVPCTGDDGCVAYYSGWANNACTSSTDCMYGICVAYDGIGGCGFGPGDLACEDVGLEATQRMDVEGNMVTVCAKPTALCDAVEGGMACRAGCTATSCGALACGADGKCHCADDIECYMAQAGERCDAQGDCQYACVTPADCPGSLFDGTTTVCE